MTSKNLYINLENGEEGVIVGNNTQRQWAFVLNNKVQAKDVIINSVPLIDFVPDDANQYYLMNGMPATKSNKGIVIVKSKDRKTRKTVKANYQPTAVAGLHRQPSCANGW